MSNRRKAPSYRLHKPTGKAIVTLPDGKGSRKDIYLGPYGSPENRREYARVLIEWEANKRSAVPAARPRAKRPDMTINELLVVYEDGAVLHQSPREYRNYVHPKKESGAPCR